MRFIDLHTGKETVPAENTILSCAVGNFDGLHIGHRELIKETVNYPASCNASAVFTFDENPHISLHNKDIRLLMTNSQKEELLKGLGADYLIYEDFESVKNLSPDEFVKEILFKKCGIRHIVCGYDFRYGKNASGTPVTLKECVESLGGTSVVIPPVEMNGTIVSSSVIRGLIESGMIKEASAMLGHSFSIESPIVDGSKLGRTFGFPTVNQDFPVHGVVPKTGVYITKTVIDGKEYPAVTDIGTKPTVTDSGKHICETHIIGYSGNLYGRTVKIDFLEYIREEKKFDDIEKLKTQIESDIKKAKTYSGGKL